MAQENGAERTHTFGYDISATHLERHSAQINKPPAGQKLRGPP